ncbi:MAG: galactose oxidase [Bacteroidota bacterium]
MKHSWTSVILFTMMILVTLSCNNNDTDTTEVGNWIRTTPFKGSRRSGAVSFVIGNKSYIGLGFNGDSYFTDIYEYDLDLGFWKTMTPFPGVTRERAVAFAIGSKAYIGLGYNRDQTTQELADFWEFDPAANTWTQLKDFGGSARYNSVSFVIDESAYVGLGNDGSNYLGDFWQYNPVDDSWTEVTSYKGQKREEASTFVLNGKAYVCGGRNNGITDNDFYVFDPVAKSWTSLIPTTDVDWYASFTTAVHRYGAVTFTMNGMAYLATGINSTGVADNTAWQYSPVTQEWVQVTSFEGSSRTDAVAFLLSGRPFVGTGQSGSSRFDDIWEFRPDEDYDAND